MDQFKKSTFKRRQLSLGKSQSLLKEEVMQLQRELECQATVRSALEKALNCQPLLDDPAYKSLSKPAEDLIREISLLESEVLYLEKYLLSLYRKSFAKGLSPLQAVDEKLTADVHQAQTLKFSRVSKTNTSFVNGDSSESLTMKHGNILGAEPLIEETGLDRSQSSLSHYSARSYRSSSPSEVLNEALDLYHSLPLTMLERTQDSVSNSNLTEHVESGLYVRETPNWLSEETIKCISKIYCHLSDPPLMDQSICSVSNSPPPYFMFSPPENGNKMLPSGEKNPSFSSRINKLFHIESSEEFNESLLAMVEVRGICKNPQKLDAVQDLLQKHRFLISSLAQVDPGKLKHEEKLAFWINIHNSLVMHAFLIQGIPRGNLKRISLVLKAAYNIGGHAISIDSIQNSILGCRLPRPTQWLQALFFPKSKFKAGDVRRSFAIKHTEPRLRFALCSGCQSDPAVRVYTPKTVFQELEMAKEEYIQMNIKPHKEQRLLIPKNIEYFIKETGLSTSGTVEMLEHSILDGLRKNLNHGKLLKMIDWMPHNFSFRFLLSNELVRL